MYVILILKFYTRNILYEVLTLKFSYSVSLMFIFKIINCGVWKPRVRMFILLVTWSINILVLVLDPEDWKIKWPERRIGIRKVSRKIMEQNFMFRPRSRFILPHLRRVKLKGKFSCRRELFYVLSEWSSRTFHLFSST